MAGIVVAGVGGLGRGGRGGRGFNGKHLSHRHLAQAPVRPAIGSGEKVLVAQTQPPCDIESPARTIARKTRRRKGV